MKTIKQHLALEGNIRIIAIQTLLSQLGFGMFYVIWQPYILSSGISVIGLGVIQSVINISTAAGLIVWGNLSDKFGRKPVIIVSNAFRVFAITALFISKDFIFMIIFAFLVGFSSLFMMWNPARNALISETVSNHNMATAFGTLISISQITNTIMASVGGYLAMVSGYYPILYCCLVGDTIGLLLFLFFLKETLKSPFSKPVKTFSDRLKEVIIPEKGIRSLYLILIVMGFGYSTGYSLFYGALVDNYEFTVLQLGLLSTAFNLTWGISSIPVSKISDSMGKKPLLLGSWAMAFITVIGFLTFKTFEAFLIFEMISALDPSLWIPAWMSLLSEKVPSGRLSTVMGKIDAYSKLASIPAPWFGGLLYAIYGFMAPLLIHLVCLLISGFFIFTLNVD